MTISTVLLIPAPGDPRLLADGVFPGSRVPTLTWCWLEMTTGADIWARPSQGARPHEPRIDALVLAYRGATYGASGSASPNVSRRTDDV